MRINELLGAIEDPQVALALVHFRALSKRMQDVSDQAVAIEEGCYGLGRNRTKFVSLTEDEELAIGNALAGDVRLLDLEAKADEVRGALRLASLELDRIVGERIARNLRACTNKELDAALAAKDLENMNRIKKTCSCGFTTDWPAAFGRHQQTCATYQAAPEKPKEINGARKTVEEEVDESEAKVADVARPTPADAALDTEADESTKAADLAAQLSDTFLGTAPTEGDPDEVLRQCVAWLDQLEPRMQAATTSYLAARFGS